MISPVFASILRSGRTEFNTRFAMARRRFPSLSAEAFSLFLETTVDFLVESVAATAPDRVADAVFSAYDAALELVGQNLAGSGSQYRFIEEGWQKIIPASAGLIAKSPERVIPAISNALFNLGTMPGVKPSKWADDLACISAQCADVETFLQVGQVLAWRAGLAHYRRSALTVLDSLPEKLALSAMGLNAAASWTDIRRRLEQDPWFDPASDKSLTARGIRIAARVGAFRGFGGLFVEPPLVACAGDDYLVKSGNDCWLLHADIYGATLHRVEASEFDKAAAQTGRLSGVRFNETTIIRENMSLDLAFLGSFSSAALNTHSLALTSPLTHAVTLIALT
ncbi:MAG: hypothetical protein K4571_01125 [Deltaproteobacteria bacterium]